MSRPRSASARALVVDGRLLRGTRGFAGELGHVPVRPEGPRARAADAGCLEQYAGEEAVLRAAGIEPGEDRVGLLAERGRGRRHGRAARPGRGAGTALGIALTGAVNLLDPETVVLGGALSELAPWLLPALEAEWPGVRRVRLRGVCLAAGTRGPLLGAAHSVVRAVLDDPAAVAGRGCSQAPAHRLFDPPHSEPPHSFG